jgi:lipopolysaccharide transport system ATP-binding protein
MSDIVIKAENLGKKYVIGHQSENGRYLALRDLLVQSARRFWHKTKDLVQGKPVLQGDTLEDVWALKDVSFEIQRGETVGIIGRNGAGKSTLLKVLSRITEPAAGRVTIKGRVASLLEVGTGFHPELTGRENIYLNGAILGMTRADIKRKFDEIVAFAEVERFLDTPVKRFSSGMYVRLAFAVAAHLEPEILLVDEVLAVGDASFQRKCLGKMRDVGTEGRTVLFVSHNMGAINRLCPTSIWLDLGTLKSISGSSHAIEQYLETIYAGSARREFALKPDCKGQITTVRLLDSHDREISQFASGDEPIVQVGFKLNVPVRGCHVACIVSSIDGCHLFSTADTDTNPDLFGERLPREYLAQVKLPTKLLNAGVYYVAVGLGVPGIESFDRQDSVSFVIHDTGDFGTFKEGSRRAGLLLAESAWEYLEPRLQ